MSGNGFGKAERVGRAGEAGSLSRHGACQFGQLLSGVMTFVTMLSTRGCSAPSSVEAKGV